MRRSLLVLAPLLLGCGPPPPVEVVDLLPRLADTVFVPAQPAADLRLHGEVGVPRTAQPFLLGEGWAAAGEGGTWAVGLEANLAVHLADDRPRSLVLEVRSRPGCSPDAPQIVGLEVNGAICGSAEVPTRWSRLAIDIPSDVLRVGENRLTLRFRDAVSPRSLGVGQDTRKLAVCVRRIGLLPEGLSLEEALVPPVEARASSDGLRIVRPATLVLPLALQPGGSRLRMQAAAAGDRSRLRLRLMDSEGRLEDLGSAAVLAPGRPIPLGPRDGGLHFLVLDAEVRDGEPVVIEGARLETPLPPPPPRRHRPAAADRPDIVVLVPDALRPDHLGCYGSARDTSPNTDRLAAESLVFTDVVATAAFTLASVPTLLTGAGFSSHGVVSEGHSLADRFTTLAEALRTAGYATAGFSGNAYHSARFGSDQGYDRFEMMWRRVPDELASFDPHAMVDLALEWLAGQDGERPILLLLHLVPPHAPYDPPPAFDLFGDPTYGGEVDGSRANLAAIRTGGMELGDADLRRLISLYDGNILRVDDAIGDLLDALRARPRWSDTAVLLTSDHGEAFFEHGQQGHVNTVYDEMLRVPFILRVPPRARQTEVDTRRQASLADVVPTLLGLAGVDPAPEVTGLDLLGAPRSALEGSARWVISRNGGHEWVTYSVRTGRFKAVADEHRHRELFDLGTDPGERINLAIRRPLLTAGLVQLLREELERSRPARTGDETLDPEDEAALRALGYL